MLSTDVLVIGGGQGGYVSAIRLAQLGKRVLLIEKDKIGGVCLNVGCIPSKALINASKLVKNARAASKLGINASVTLDFPKLQEWKQGVVNKLTSGISSLCKTYNIQVIHGEAKFISAKQIEVKKEDSSITKIEFKEAAIIATGSSPTELPNLRFDGERIVSSTEALAFAEIPMKLLIIGGGVIGLEIGMAYANLFGTELTVIEMLDQLLPGVDADLVNPVYRSLKTLKATIHLKSKVISGEASAEGAKVKFESSEGLVKSVEVDHVLVSVGRRPNSNNIGLENIGICLTERGFIKVDSQMRTSITNIFAVGDVVGEPLLAHKASRQGIVAAEVICGMKSSFEDVLIPSVIFTDPEIATVGMKAAEISEQNVQTVSGKFPFSASGRALTSPESPDGFAKIVAEKKTGKVLGVGIVGQESSNLISEATLALEMGAVLEDIALTVHPHPTLPETIMESAENALGRAIHILNVKRTY